ncbi:class I SAM-dependent methyltransferase [Nocardioides acrostichi]|uniref:Class I SAM-dependent methyltransferase n=1 Tax=Nocardioides acrostichi TaxID=2784339 RepID=A0A930UWM9_9ACTN|nr:class I SAM-dependent methyltransferase [Nocardioides acrostichi]MBF4161037.1 class I SAM-dependent methyltransferase [Nocardioides acrostichi]
MRPPDAVFADPRQAALYDWFDDDRSDLDHYVAIVDELGASTVVDIGCGTGSLAVLLAEQGVRVIGVDPAGASLDVARAKPGAGRVTWVHGDATALAGHAACVDLAVMTGNVAQVFVDDADWHATLGAVRAVLEPGGWFVFETRRPQARAWEGWQITPTRLPLPDGRTATVERTVTDVALPLVTFTGSMTVEGEVLRSTSTLRFRDLEEIRRDLAEHGLRVTDVREAPDRPGLEYVVLARV